MFLSGKFSVRKSYIPENKTVKKLLGGNRVYIYFRQKTFSFIVANNIRYFVLNSSLKNLFKKVIEDELKPGGSIDENKISIRVCTCQVSKTFDNISDYKFVQEILVPFCTTFKIPSVFVDDESSGCGGRSTIPLSNFLDKIETKQICFPSSISVSKNRKTWQNRVSHTLKFQFNGKTNQTHLSAIFTDFFPETRQVLNWIESR